MEQLRQQHEWLHEHPASPAPQINTSAISSPAPATLSPVAPVHPPNPQQSGEITPTTWDRHVTEERTASPDIKQQNQHLRQLSSETNPEKLEKGVEKAVELLEELENSLREGSEGSENAMHWMKLIHDAKKGAIRNRTVIGVVGNTGAGKSSVINALLDEERLVPTNCMRACTAVVTELSYNDSNNDESRYKADVEFIKAEDWHKELETLFDDILDGSGNVSKEASNADTEAGVAFAKIKAVYPNKTKDQLASGGLEVLKRDPAVNRVLGATRHIEESHSNKFYQRLQTYVDSQEKSTGHEKKKKKGEPKPMEYWPLIKVVKIYTKAEALSTGAVLVDLPGVHDSNAARAAVADGYMKQCTGLWIVAPITRAVDDKAAKSLLGDSFKRQLKLDGTYDNVTFICSKTDDISIEEAVQSLDLGQTAEKSWQESDEMRSQIEELKAKVKEHRESKSVFQEVVDQCDEQIEEWEKLESDLSSGKTVYAPVDKKKRKKSSAKSGSQKRRRTNDSNDSNDDFINDDSEVSEASCSESEDENESEDRHPLTEEDIEAKIQELRSRKKNARNQREEVERQTKGLNKDIKALIEKRDTIDHEISSLCIKGRNDYSRGAIQQDFAAGIKDLDQEAAIEEDEANFDPDEELRDYEEVARSLPVFCISSRAFQKLSGRLKRDKAISGFENVNETEMPQLQAHCKKLTEAGRSATSRKFLNNLCQLLNSMGLWASRDSHGSQLTVGQQRKEIQFLEQKLTELYNVSFTCHVRFSSNTLILTESHQGFNKIVDDCITALATGLTDNIFEKYERAVSNAAEASVPTCEKWGKKKNEGGLHWGTYRATVRRNGVFSGSSGPRDFNGELAEPMIKQVASGWERTFQRILPAQIDVFKARTLQLLVGFHDTVMKRAHDNGVSIASIAMLRGQLQNYEPFLAAQAHTIKEMITVAQREVNREFTPVIAAAMEQAYVVCGSIVGPGTYMRMKEHMAQHVSTNRTKMFQDACNAVRDQLQQMSARIRVQLAERTDSVYSTVKRDYLMVLGNLGAADASQSPAELRLREDVADVLESGEEIFRRIVENEEVDVESEEHETSVEEPDENHDIRVESVESDEMNTGGNGTTETTAVTEDAHEEEPRQASSSSAARSSTPRHWESEDTLVGSEKENEGVPTDKLDARRAANTATAHGTALQPLSNNF